jgi:hypothetical protein
VELRLPVASPFRQPYVNSVLGSSLILIPWERSISKGSPTQFPSLRYVSPLSSGAFGHEFVERHTSDDVSTAHKARMWLVVPFRHTSYAVEFLAIGKVEGVRMRRDAVTPACHCALTAEIQATQGAFSGQQVDAEAPQLAGTVRHSGPCAAGAYAASCDVSSARPALGAHETVGHGLPDR